MDNCPLYFGLTGKVELHIHTRSKTSLASMSSIGYTREDVVPSLLSEAGVMENGNSELVFMVVC